MCSRSCLVFALVLVCLSFTAGKHIHTNVTTGIVAVLNDAVDGDVIILSSGSYTGESNMNLELCGRTLTFQSASGSPNDVIIDVKGNNSQTPLLIYYNNSTTIDYSKPTNISYYGITFKNGGSQVVDHDYALVGGIMAISSENITGTIDIYIDNCQFQDGYADYGGVIYAEADTTPIRIFITSSVFISNQGGYGSSIYGYNSTITITDCTFYMVASIRGAIHLYDSVLDLSNSKFKECVTYDMYPTFGAAVFSYGSNLYIDNSYFLGNAAGFGGVIAALGPSDIIVNNSLFEENRSEYGGSIFIEAVNLVVYNSTLAEGLAEHSGGAICALEGSQVEIYHSQLTDNSASNGGAITAMNGTTVKINNSVLSHNFALDDGAVVYAARDSSVLVSDSYVTENSADYGGGFYITHCSLTLENTQIANNNASTAGAAIFCTGAGTVKLIQSPITRNNRSSEKNDIYCYKSSPNTCYFYGDGEALPTACQAKDPNVDSPAVSKAGRIAVIVIFVIVGVAVITTVIVIIVRKRMRSSTSFIKM